MGRRSSKRPGMARRGLSLLELLVALGLLSVFLWIGGVQFRGAPSGAATHALAERLAQELRTARHQAITAQVPVAVAFPSSNGTVPHSQGWSRLVGEDHPQITQTTRTSTDFPGTVVFLGLWGTAALDAGTAAGANRDARTLNGWVDPPTRDFLLQFQPSGVVVSNQLPRWNGEYRLLVSQSISYTAASASSVGPLDSRPNYFTPQAVYKPYTVCLTPMGGVTVHPGVVGGAPGAPAELDFEPPAAAVAATPATPVGPGGNAPALVEVTRRPTQSDTLAGGQQSIEVYATDDDGGPLYLSGSASHGTFSEAGETRMLWNEARRCWQGTLSWQAPSPASPLQVDLQCTVRDEQGHRVTSDASQLSQEDVRGSDFLIAASPNPPETFLYFTPSGRLLDTAYPAPSRTGRPLDVRADGKQLAYWDNYGGVFHNVIVATSDGSRTLGAYPDLIDPSFSADGTSIAARRTTGPGLAVIDLRDGLVHELCDETAPATPVHATLPVFASTSSRLVYYPFGSPGVKIAEYVPATHCFRNPVDLYVPPAGVSRFGAARFSWDDKYLAFGLSDGTMVLHDLAANTNEILHPPGINSNPDHPCFSPDGASLAFKNSLPPGQVYLYDIAAKSYRTLSVPVCSFGPLCWAPAGYPGLRR